jgi:hypothetical protein
LPQIVDTFVVRNSQTIASNDDIQSEDTIWNPKSEMFVGLSVAKRGKSIKQEKIAFGGLAAAYFLIVVVDVLHKLVQIH